MNPHRWMPLALAGLLLASPALAAVGAAEVTPGSTLLLPYFEVDTAHPGGADTQVTVTNAGATAVLVHVTVWTDLGIPVHGFNVYLTGLDQATLDLGTLLRTGVVEATATAGQDYRDEISMQGPFSQDINFASCSGPTPDYTPDRQALPIGPVRPLRLAELNKALTGQASLLFDGKCGGAAVGDGLARGFITLDSVNQCTGMNPTVPGYFVTGGAGVATTQRLITGTFTLRNREAGLAMSAPLVALEATRGLPADPETTIPGQATFYGPWVGYSAADNREALPSRYLTRYGDDGLLPTAADTSFLVWRAPVGPVSAFTCGEQPSGFPLTAASAVAFDDQDNPTSLGGDLFPRVTQRVSASDLGLPGTRGALQLDLNGTTAGGAPENPKGRQAWVMAVQQGEGGATGAVLPTVALDKGGTGLLVLAPAAKVVAETGTQTTLSVSLSAVPTSTVTVPIVSTDPGELTVSPASLTFTPQDALTPQQVTVTGQDDADLDGPQAVTINAGPMTSADADFQGTSGSAVLTNQDDELVQLSPSGSTTTEAGGTIQVSVHLVSTLPYLGEEFPADWGYELPSVVLHFTSSNPQEATVSPETLTFSPFGSSAQTLTVTGVDDAVDDGDVGFNVGITVTSNVASYDGTPTAPLSFTNTDDD